MVDVQVDPNAAPVSEEDRQIEGYHNALHALFKGADDVIIAQAVASFMGCHLSHTSDWRRIIPGFIKEMLDYANLAMAAHRQAETIAQPEFNNKENDHGGKKESS